MQLLFNFTEHTPDELPPGKRNLKLALRRAAIKWLADLNLNDKPAIGIDVPTRGSALKADVAAAWITQTKTKLPDGRLATVLQPTETAVVICATERDDCWPECAEPEKIISEISRLKTEVAVMEKNIRETEPELRDSTMLFDEFAAWNYGNSKNNDYHLVHKRLAQLEYSLFKGSRLARICNAQAANKIFLAVPKGTLNPDEVCGTWGLLEVDVRSLEATLEKDAQLLLAPEDIKISLALAIANCSTQQVADCHGLKFHDDKPADVLRMPRFRRTPPRSSQRN